MNQETLIDECYDVLDTDYEDDFDNDDDFDPFWSDFYDDDDFDWEVYTN